MNREHDMGACYYAIYDLHKTLNVPFTQIRPATSPVSLVQNTQYTMALYAVDCNDINLEPMCNITSGEIVEAYRIDEAHQIITKNYFR